MKRLLVLLMLSGCATAPLPVPSEAQDTCNAGQYVDLISQDATALETTMLLGKVRIIRPGDAVTMDFLTDRINFMVDNMNRITSITCG